MADDETTQSTEPKRLEIKRVYLKDASFESPHAPGVLEQQWQPRMDVQLHSSGKRLEQDNLFEVVLQLTVTARQEETTIFLAEVEQAGTFEITGLADHEIEPALQIHCPSVLFPFARESIASLIAKGGFPQLLLTPINFEAVYRQKQKALQDQQHQSRKPH